MKLLQELLTNVHRLDDQSSPDESDELDQMLADFGGQAGGDVESGEDDLNLDPDSGDQDAPPKDDNIDFDLDPDVEGESEDDQMAQQATEDPDRAGVIRAVKNAHLVYKRQTDDGTYDELWVYNVKEFDTTLSVKKAILAGTDIGPGQLQSPSGEQTYTSWASGNAEMLLIKGLPN